MLAGLFGGLPSGVELFEQPLPLSIRRLDLPYGNSQRADDVDLVPPLFPQFPVLLIDRFQISLQVSLEFIDVFVVHFLQILKEARFLALAHYLPPLLEAPLDLDFDLRAKEERPPLETIRFVAKRSGKPPPSSPNPSDILLSQ